jgi:hypothetical protein
VKNIERKYKKVVCIKYVESLSAFVINTYFQATNYNFIEPPKDETRTNG